MRKKLVLPIIAILAIVLPSVTTLPRIAQDDLKIILVDLAVKSPADAPKCFSNQFDRKRVEVTVDIDDPLYTMEDFAMSEDPLEGPDCFMPEMKVIFREYSYVFSMYCSAVVKYRNSAPYIPSGKKMQPDIEMTESVVELLDNTRKKYFNTPFDPALAAKFVKTIKLEDEKVDDKELYEEDEEESEDRDIEKDALDKEGWFDKVNDPGLEDETPEEEEGDGGKKGN